MDFTGIGVYADPPLGGWYCQLVPLTHLVITSIEKMMVIYITGKGSYTKIKPIQLPFLG